MADALQTRHKIDLSAKEFREMRREFTVDRAGIDMEKRTVPMSFASEEPVERWFGREILDISTDACDMSRLNNAAAFLVNHNWDDQVGVIVEASIDKATKKARCVVRFSKSTRGNEIFQDIVDGIRTLVSVGYVVKSMVLQSVDDGLETHRVTSWMPFEVSTVAVPADSSVGVGRAQDKPDKPAAPPVETLTTSRKMSTETLDKTKNDGADPIAAERKRVKELNDSATQLAQRHPKHAEALRGLASNCIANGDTVDSFNRTVLADILKSDPANPALRQGDAAIGLGQKDVKRYSALRAIRMMADLKPLDGLELEASQEVARKLGRQPTGFFLPDEVIADQYASRMMNDPQKRTLLATSAPDGGYTVGSQILSSEFVELLRNNTVVVPLGARFIPGLVGDVSIPRQLTGATAYWVPETGAITAGSATFGQIVSRPKRIGTSVPYTKQFLAQSSLGAEAFVINDSDLSTAVELDRVAIRGGGGSEPLGILNMATADRSTSVTFGAAATWAKYLEFFSNVATNNALLGQPAYVTTPASAVKAQSIQKFATYGDPIWEDDMVGTFRARWTTQINSSGSGTLNQVIFGDFSQVLYLEWAGRDVVVDPYTRATYGEVIVTIQRLMDMVIRRGKSFAISSDSGAQ